MKNFLKNLGLIEEAPSVKKEASPQPEVKPQISTPVHFNTEVFVESSDINKIRDTLFDVFKQANLQGVDFYEFYMALQNVESHPIPEQEKYKFVFSTLSSLGATKQQIIDSFDHYKSVFENEKVDYEGYIANRVKTEVEDKKLEHQKINEENQELINKVQENKERMKELESQINLSQNSIESSKSVFSLAFTQFTERLQTILSNIEKFIN